jgi:hypothetical protein
MKINYKNVGLLILLVFLSTACERDQVSEIVTTVDLTNRLEEAGFAAEGGGSIRSDILQSEGRILVWDAVQVEVYEYVDQTSRIAISDDINRDDLTLKGVPITSEGRITLWVSGKIIVLYRGIDGGTIMLLNGLLGDPLSYEVPSIDEPFPPAVVAAIRYVAEMTGIDPELIQVRDYEEVDWGDACLGLASTDESCAQVITPGWRIDILANDILLEIRSDFSGSVIRSSGD